MFSKAFKALLNVFVTSLNLSLFSALYNSTLKIDFLILSMTFVLFDYDVKVIDLNDIRKSNLLK